MSQFNSIPSGHGYPRSFQQSTFPLRNKLRLMFFHIRHVVMALAQKTPTQNEKTNQAQDRLVGLSLVSECEVVITRPTRDSITHLGKVEKEHLVELGHWHHRRHRRRGRLRR
jgi:hypothetical protein